MSTLNNYDLGQITSERHRKMSNLEQQTYPLSDSNEASVFDYSGVKRVITITGTYTADNLTDLWNWVADMDALQNGEQETIIFHSDNWANTTRGNYQDGNFNVKVDSFEVNHTNTAKLMVTYTVVLFEGEVGI